jgi:hypothetical protein
LPAAFARVSALRQENNCPALQRRAVRRAVERGTGLGIGIFLDLPKQLERRCELFLQFVGHLA